MRQHIFLFLFSFMALFPVAYPLLQLRIDSSPHTCAQTCDGSTTNPYLTLIDALVFVSQNPNSSNIELIFATSRNNTYFLNESELNALQNDSNTGLYKIAVNSLVFMPENCNYSSNESCTEDNNVNIFLNTELITFNIKESLVLYHINLQGGEQLINSSAGGLAVKSWGLFELAQTSSVFQTLFCKITSLNTLIYSYFISGSAKQGTIILKNTSFDGVTFKENLIFLSSEANIIQIVNCNFNSLEMNFVLLCNQDSQTITMISNDFSNVNSGILSMASSNTLQINLTNFDNIDASASNNPLLVTKNNNNLTFYAVKFSTITNPNAYGGLIGIDSKNQLNFLNSTVKSCSAHVGGVLYANSFNEININYSTFESCQSQYDCGVIYLNLQNNYKGNTNYFSLNSGWKGAAIYSNVSNMIYSEFSTYTQNKAFYLGNKEGGLGGVICLNVSTNLSLYSEKFDANIADGEGGSIFSNYSNYLYLNSLTFTKNLVGDKGAGVSFSLGQLLIVKSCKFIENSAGLWGGGVYSYSYTVENHDNYFENNKATHGSSWFINVNSNFLITNMTVNGSKTVGGFGVIYGESGNNFTVFNSSFMNLSIDSSAVAWAGGTFFFNRNNNFTLRNLVIADSKASSQAGTFYLFTGNQVFLYNVSITRSSTVVSWSSGGVFSLGSSNKVYLENVTSDISQTGNIAGFIYCDNLNVIEMIRVIVKKSVGVTGGAIYSSNNNTFSLNYCRFEDTYATSQSGMFGMWTNNYIYINNSEFHNSMGTPTSAFSYLITYNTFIIYNSTFSLMNPKGFGTIGAFLSNTLKFYSTTFKDSYNLGNDGGVFNIESSNTLEIDSCLFENITAAGSGGVLMFSQSNTAIIKSSKFMNTVAMKQGAGALFFINTNQVTIDSCIFINNIIATSGAGGVMVFDLYNTLMFTNNTYMNSQSPVSGSFASFGSNNNYQETGSRFYNINNAINNGNPTDAACFYVGSSNFLSITDCEFVNITSQNSGAIFYVSLLNILLATRIKFHNISAVFAGALLYAEEQNNCIFDGIQGDTVNGNLFGAGIYVLFSNVISIDNSHITNIMNLGSGAFAYIKDLNKIMVKNSNFSDVFAQTSGGFIYAEISNSFVLMNLNLRNFSVKGSGGLIYFSRNNNLTINNSFISNIDTGFRGGILYTVGGNQIYFGNVDIASINGLDLGCLYYSLSFNIFYFENNIITDIKCFISPGNIIFLADANTVSFQNSSINNYQFAENVDFFYGQQNNTLFFENNTISSNYSQIFFNLLANHTLYINNMRVLRNSTFNTFIYMSNGVLNIKRLFLKFNIHHAVFHLTQQTYAYISRSSLIPASIPTFSATSSLVNSTSFVSVIDLQKNLNSFIVIYISSSQLNLTKCNILNALSMNLSPIYALQSTIFMKKVFGFGARGLHAGGFAELHDSLINLQNNIIFESKALAGSCISMNFSTNFLINPENISDILTSRILLQINKRITVGLSATMNNLRMNKARLEGGALLFSIDPELDATISLNLHQNTLQNNEGWTGGAIALQYVQSGNFSNNIFKGNKAVIGTFTDQDALNLYYEFSNTSQAKGGAIFTENSSGLVSSSNEFIDNQANIGGAIYSPTPINETNDTFIDNSAKYYGDNLASLVEKLTFLLKSSLYEEGSVQIINYAELNDVVSSKTGVANRGNCLIRIAGVDKFNNVLFNSDQQDNYASRISFVGTNDINPQYTATVISSVENGQLCVLGAVRNQLPLQVPFRFQVFLDNHPTELVLKIVFRNCVIGERLTDDYQCVECSPGYYSFQTVFTETSICLPCTDNDPFVCLGGNRLSPKPGYWRSDANSRNFLKCPKPDACIPYNYSLFHEALGMNSTSLANDITSLIALGSLNSFFFTGSCEIGFEGPYCDTCASEYGKIGKLNCILCADSSWFYYLLIVLQIVIKIWYLFYCVLMAFKMIIAITMKNASEGAVIALNMLKILVIHIQIMSFILKMPLDWSDNLKTYLPILFSFSPDISEAFNFECFMKSLGWTLSEQYFILVLCPVYIILMFTISLLFVGIRKNNAKSQAIRKISNYKLGICVFFIIIILTYIDLSKVNLEMFQCINISDARDPDYRLVNDVSVICNGTSHDLWKYILAVPVLFICVLLVVFIVSKLTVDFFRNKMDSKETKLEFGYFYYAYKRKYYYWDFIILMRRLLILFFFLFFYEDLVSKSMFPILLMILTLFGSLALQIYIHPFEGEFEIVNQTEQYSLIVLCLSYMIMMMYATFYFNGYNIPVSLFFVTTLSILVINVLFIGMWGYHYYVFYFSRKVRTFVQAIRDTIRQDRTVWLERLQKEHHVLNKIHAYFVKKQFLLAKRNENREDYLISEMFDGKKKQLDDSTGLYSKLLYQTMEKIRNEESQINNSFPDELFECKVYKSPEYESLMADTTAMSLRLSKNNLRQALFGEEVLLYESPMGKFKIIYKKILKGRNYYTYNLSTEVKIMGELEPEIKKFEIENRKNVFSSVELNTTHDSESKYSHTFTIRTKYFASQYDYLNFCMQINTLDSYVSVYTIRIPMSILFFLRFIQLGKHSKFIEAYMILNESLLSRTFRIKNDAATKNLINEIDQLFPFNRVMKTKHSFVQKYMGVFSLLTKPNEIFTYNLKINEKLREVSLEILIVMEDGRNKVELQRIAYKIIQSFGYLLTNAY